MTTFGGPTELSMRLERPPSIPLQIANQLLDFLLSGAIAPGARVPSERKLAEALGVSRSAIRDALQPLALLGLIEIRQGDGTYLRRASSALLPDIIEWGRLLGEADVLDLVETRRYIEIGIAELAAVRRDETDILDLWSILDRMNADQSVEEFTALDIAFHLRLAQASGNHSFIGLIANIRSLLDVWLAHGLEKACQTNALSVEHPAIVHAIERRDSREAGLAMARHLDAATTRLMASLGSGLAVPLEPTAVLSAPVV